MQQAVAKCPNIKLECLGMPLPLLLDPESYFDQYIKPVLWPAYTLEAFTHNLFELKGAN